MIIYYNDIGTVGYTLDVDIKYPEQFRMVQKQLLFWPKNWKLVHKKFICNLKGKKKYVLHLRNFKQALDHGLKLENAHGGIKFD